jgi:hypothetical protein
MEPTWKARSIGYIIDFELNKIFIMVLLTSAATLTKNTMKILNSTSGALIKYISIEIYF